MKLQDTAIAYLREGLSVIPVGKDKRPALPSWDPYKTNRMEEEEAQRVFNSWGIAIICGAISGGLEVVDIDSKYDLTGSLWEDYKGLLEDQLTAEVFNSLVIAQTKSGGYHIYYRSSKISGNTKLARRRATDQEIQAGDQVKVLLETRGEGGYAVAPPTPGYKFIQGDPLQIPTISPQERDLILNIARSFNEIREEATVRDRPTSSPYPGLSPFEDYNQRGDVIGLMEGHGWRVVNTKGDRINLLRPGETSSKTSGNYHRGLRLLYIWSTSTQFDPEKAYSPSNVYALLECNGDLSTASRRLYEEGYGERRTSKQSTPTQEITSPSPDLEEEFSRLLIPVTEEEIRQRQALKPDSLRSGYLIDGEELLLPSGALTIIAGPTSHGKTTLLINTALNVAEAYPDQEVYLFSYEEDGDTVIMNALNTYLGEPLSMNNRRTIQAYFKNGSPEFVREAQRDNFITKKDQFFKELIGSRRLSILYTSYDSDTLIEAIRYLHRHASPGAIFIDYMQLLHKGTQGRNKYHSRQEELKQVCLDLKDLAVETGLPVILGAQFNRTVVNHLDLHPTTIGEAGDIERIANTILGIWNNNFEPVGTDGELSEISSRIPSSTVANTLYAILLKNRGGKVGLRGSLSFNGNTGKIANSTTQRTETNNPF